MRFIKLFFMCLMLGSLLTVAAFAKTVVLSCPTPQQLHITQDDPNSVSATLQVLKGEVTPIDMFPLLTTFCKKITRNEFAAFYEGVLDCDYSCQYANKTDELLFYSTNVGEMQPQLHNCKFAEGDAHECHYAGNKCELLCDTTSQ